MGSEEWLECKLADACSSIDYGLTASATDVPLGPRFLRITDIVSGTIDWNSVPYVQADEDIAMKYRLDSDDIVLARTGASTGASAYVNAPPPAVFASYLVRLKANSGFNSRFLAYYLKSDHFQFYLRGVLGDKSAQPNASASTMTQAPLRAPKNLATQRAIAHILGTLDDKIEMNRRMNETLEGIARAIFKSWFVDFDPVRAKVEGREIGLPDEIADLFPDQFEKFPVGWEVVPFVDTIDIVGGGTPKTSEAEYWNGDIPWFSIADAPRDADIFVIDTQKKISQLGLENSAVQLLPKGTTIISARGTVGRVALAGIPMAMNQSCYGLVDRESPQGFYLYFTTRRLVPALLQQTHGSVFDTITRQTFSAVNVPVPPQTVVTAFEDKLAPLMERVLNNIQESRTLVTLREILLPKLITGQLRIPAAERIIGEVV